MSKNLINQKTALLLLLALSVLIASPSVQAGGFSPSSFSLDTAIANLTAAFGSIQSLIIAISYTMGVGFVVKGLIALSVLGRTTMSSSSRGEIGAPVMSIIIGSLLIYLPSTLSTSLTTIFGDDSLGQLQDLTAYQALSSVERWQSIANVCASYLELVGLVAFVRGFVLLSKLGNSGGQQGGFGKGLIHIIGGVLLINIVETFNILATTLGYTG